MSVACPNCGKEFIEHRETAYRCETCGWLQQVDDKWVPCPEPPKQQEPKPVEPVPTPEPDPSKPADPPKDRNPPIVREYLGGIVTVTETEDDEDGQP
jgi:hypothetical protein